MKGLWDEAQPIAPWSKSLCGGCKCDLQKLLIQMKEREQMYDFLMGLDDVFATVKTQILSMTPTLTLGQAYHLVAEDEKQRLVLTLHKSVTETTAFQTNNIRYKNNDMRGGGKKERPRCDLCQKVGHIQKECWEIMGYPADWKKPNSDKQGSWNNKKGGFKAAQAGIEESPVPGLSMQQYEKLLQQLKDYANPIPGKQPSKPVVNTTGNPMFERH